MNITTEVSMPSIINSQENTPLSGATMGNRRFLFRVPEGEEIIDFMTRFFDEFQVTSGVISAIGSLIDPKIGYFDRKRGST